MIFLWLWVFGCGFLVGLPLFHGYWLWVVGFGLLVRLPFLMEDFSVSKANPTQNP